MLCKSSVMLGLRSVLHMQCLCDSAPCNTSLSCPKTQGGGAWLSAAGRACSPVSP